MELKELLTIQKGERLLFTEDNALAITRHRVEIVPVKADRSLCVSSIKDASADPKQIGEWARKFKGTDVGIGIVTNKNNFAGVLDIDIEKD